MRRPHATRPLALGAAVLTAATALLTDWNAPDADLEHPDYELPLSRSRSDTREMATV